MSTEKLKGNGKPLSLFLFLSLPHVKKTHPFVSGLTFSSNLGTTLVSDSCFNSPHRGGGPGCRQITQNYQCHRADLGSGGEPTQIRERHSPGPSKLNRPGQANSFYFGLFLFFMLPHSIDSSQSHLFKKKKEKERNG